MSLKIGIIKEGKNPPDRRVPFTPEQCKKIENIFSGTEVIVQQSNVRAFQDEEYSAAGFEVMQNVSEANVLFGVKEVNIHDLIPNKTYFFFSHTIKKQSYNRDLLIAVLEKNITLVDYECLKNKNGIRLVGFGRYAGIVGGYNAFLAYGKRTGAYDLKPANQCEDRKEMEREFPKIKIPSNFKIVLSGTGRVAKGAGEVLEALNIPKVSPRDYLNKNFKHPVYTQLAVEDYNKTLNGEVFVEQEFYNNPERFQSDFFKYAKVSDLFIAGHYWDSKAPVFFTQEQVKSAEFKISTIADISCDIAGPIPTTIRPSTIADPIYQVNRQTFKETNSENNELITVMAVDNLPCELPKDASQDFGEELIDKVLPSLIGKDSDKIIERATIAKGGELTSNFEYLRDYVEGKEN